MVVAGKPGNAYSDFLAICGEYGDRIVYLNHLPPNVLQAEISNARCMVFPSLYEGFGLPSLEGLLNDNIVVSDTTSLGEISKEFEILDELRSVRINCGRMNSIEFAEIVFDR